MSNCILSKLADDDFELVSTVLLIIKCFQSPIGLYGFVYVAYFFIDFDRIDKVFACEFEVGNQLSGFFLKDRL